MPSVFVLQHVHSTEDDVEDCQVHRLFTPRARELRRRWIAWVMPPGSRMHRTGSTLMNTIWIGIIGSRDM